MKLAGISDLDTVPQLTDPEHNDVKLVLMMYSLESFLFKRLNQSSRDKDIEAIKTLGPFSVALTRIINNVQSNRKDRMEGPFTCYSGLAISKTMIEQWKKQDYLSLDGYRSSSLKEKIAKDFALKGETDVLDQVVLHIKFENKKGKYYICLDRPDYTMYLDE